MPSLQLSSTASTAAAVFDVGALMIGLDVGKRVEPPVVVVEVTVVMVVVWTVVVVLEVDDDVSVLEPLAEQGIVGLSSFLLSESSRGVLKSSSIKSPAIPKCKEKT